MYLFVVLLCGSLMMTLDKSLGSENVLSAGAQVHADVRQGGGGVPGAVGEEAHRGERQGQDPQGTHAQRHVVVLALSIWSSLVLVEQRYRVDYERGM